MKKQNRRDDEIKEQVAIALREIKNPNFDSLLVTVISAEVSLDLKHAKIFVSILGEEKEAILEILKKSSGFLKSTIATKTSLRTMPTLHFELDTSLDYATKIENILKGL